MRRPIQHQEMTTRSSFRVKDAERPAAFVIVSISSAISPNMGSSAFRKAGRDSSSAKVGVNATLAIFPSSMSTMAANPLRVSLPTAALTPMGTSPVGRGRSEEHTSELQSLMRLSYADFGLKKKNK